MEGVKGGQRVEGGSEGTRRIERRWRIVRLRMEGRRRVRVEGWLVCVI